MAKSNISAEHPKFNVMDVSQASMTLVDIGLKRKADKEGRIHNHGFGDWDGQIIHFKTRADKEYVLLMRNEDWPDDSVTPCMDAYASTFRTLNSKGSLISYDFDEADVREIIAWPPIPSGYVVEEVKKETSE
jgi:hypothetical protein